MSPNLPIKSSSRSGRFKKKLIPEAFLLGEATYIESSMEKVLEFHHQEKLSDVALTTIYLLLLLSHRHPGTWLGSLKSKPLPAGDLSFALKDLALLGLSFEPNIEKRLAKYSTLGDIVAHFALKSTPEAVNRALLQWSLGVYPLELMFRIPKPFEVLNQQKKGRRCVSVLTDPTIISKFILGERDALSFTMHDLIHADHFYFHNESYQGQLGFYGFLDFCLKEKHFDEHLKVTKFQAEFEYLIADMNAYAVHLLKCLKSALIHFHPRGEDFFKEWIHFLKLESSENKAWSQLNTADYEDSQDLVLLNFLHRYQH